MVSLNFYHISMKCYSIINFIIYLFLLIKHFVERNFYYVRFIRSIDTINSYQQYTTAINKINQTYIATDIVHALYIIIKYPNGTFKNFRINYKIVQRPQNTQPIHIETIKNLTAATSTCERRS